MQPLGIGREAVLDEIRHEGWVAHALWENEVGSTNDVARQWLQQAGRTPALFVADRQTAGRGRSAHRWWSPPGCLMFTLAIGQDQLRPDPACWGQLALVCGVALVEAASEFVPAQACQLKWPNDLYLQGKKCAGILIESAVDGWLIGIGVNVQVDLSDAPAEIQQSATSMHLLATQRATLSTSTLLLSLLGRLRQGIINWASGDDAWLSVWQEHCLLTGRNVQIRQAAGRLISGVVEGIDFQGQLRVRTPSGLAHANSGEVVAWY